MKTVLAWIGGIAVLLFIIVVILFFFVLQPTGPRFSAW
jgi:hypothetical protein